MALVWGGNRGFLREGNPNKGMGVESEETSGKLFVEITPSTS